MATEFKYTILRGDTLNALVLGVNQAAGVSVAQIANANPGVAPTALQIGMLVNIPNASTGATALRYTILSGDSYSRLAAALACETRSGLTVAEVESANPGLSPTALQIGEVIAIPPSGSPAGATVPPSTSPEPTSSPATVVGYWDKTWSPGTGPSGTNIGVAFSGYANVNLALQNGRQVINHLEGAKYLSIGGGAKSTGSITAAVLEDVVSGVQNRLFTGYQGIAFDVEVGDAGLESQYEAAFAAVKAGGLKVLVTVSHSEPYGISDAKTLMKAFIASSNIDILSPQLYSSGSESQNDYTAVGTPWSAYSASKALIAPSIVAASYYSSAVNYFAQHGVKLSGFIQWKTIR